MKHVLLPFYKEKRSGTKRFNSKRLEFEKKMAYDLVVQDKGPFARFERQGSNENHYSSGSSHYFSLIRGFGGHIVYAKFVSDKTMANANRAML